MMTTGCGIAVAGIWIGVGICSFNMDVGFVSVMGMLGTGIIAMCSIKD